MLRARYSALLQESFYRTKLILFHIFLSYREVFNISSALTNASNTYHESVSMKITTFMRLFDCCGGGVRGGSLGKILLITFIFSMTLIAKTLASLISFFSKIIDSSVATVEWSHFLT